MWKTALATLLIVACPACDGYKYKGMDGRQALAAANKMNLADSYKFYIATYSGTSPPMLDVAPTFRRFGARGTAYLTSQSLATSDPNEFEASMMALLVLDNSCAPSIHRKLEGKARSLGVSVSYVDDACATQKTVADPA